MVIKRKINFFLLIFIFILIADNSIVINASADNNEKPWWYNTIYGGGPYNSDLEKLGMIGGLLNFFVGTLYKLFGWFNIGAGRAPKYYFSKPDTINISYLETKTINITWGVNSTNESREPWHRFQSNVFPEFSLYYEAVYPENFTDGIFRAVFDPPLFDVKDYDEMVGGKDSQAPQVTTKLNLTLDIPPDPTNPVKDFLLQINVSIYRKYGNLTEIFGFFGTLFGGFLKAQNAAEVGHRNFSIHVRINPFRNAELYIPPAIEMDLDDLKKAKIKVQNRGTHVEQFGFIVSGADDSLIVNTPPPITIYPGDINSTEVGLLTKPIAYDRGTVHSVKIEVFPYDEPGKILTSGILSVRTKGVSLAGVLTSIYFFVISIFIIIVILVLISYTIYKNHIISKLIKKPDKPWKIKEEKKFLRSLKENNKWEDVKLELKLMEDEYISSILWYKHNKKYITKERRKKNRQKMGKSFHEMYNNFMVFYKKFKTDKIKKPEIIREVTIVDKIDKKNFIDIEKEKILKKIRKQLEKQNKGKYKINHGKISSFLMKNHI